MKKTGVKSKIWLGFGQCSESNENGYFFRRQMAFPSNKIFLAKDFFPRGIFFQRVRFVLLVKIDSGAITCAKFIPIRKQTKKHYREKIECDSGYSGISNERITLSYWINFLTLRIPIFFWSLRWARWVLFQKFLPPFPFVLQN